METVKFVEKNQTATKDKQKERLVFKVLSLGAFMQDLPDNVTVLNRPQICVDDKRKKWGNEYILMNKNVSSDPNFKYFLGSFGLDKKRRMNIHLFKQLEIPIKKPDYYIITVNHDGKLDKAFDLIKADASSFSKIFSSAYHQFDDGMYSCETILVLQHGDKVMLNGTEYLFSGKSESLE